MGFNHIHQKDKELCVIVKTAAITIFVFFDKSQYSK